MNKAYLGVLLALCAAGGTDAVAQTVVVDRTGGYAWDSPYNRLYDSSKMVTFSGKITGIQVMPPMRGMADGATILVKASNGGTALVDLGPAWFVNNQPIRFKVRDRVNVTGSKVIVDGRGTILASRISKGNDVLVLRNIGGQPLWAAYQVLPNGAVVDPIPGTTAYSGTIEAINGFQNGGVTSTDLVLRTANGTINVDLGPQWFLDRQGMTFDVGSNVTVYTGGQPIQVGNTTILPGFGLSNGPGFLRLRWPGGWPMWQGWNPPRFLIGGGG
jgi:hypothetical protein